MHLLGQAVGGILRADRKTLLKSGQGSKKSSRCKVRG